MINFVYRNGEYAELLPPGLHGGYVTRINDNGVVLGYGFDGAETYTWYLFDGKEYNRNKTSSDTTG